MQLSALFKHSLLFVKEDLPDKNKRVEDVDSTRDGTDRKDEEMLYLIRHGQTEYNVTGQLQGTADSPLTERGIREAKRLKKSLRDTSFSCFYSSVLGRAIHTAMILQEDREVPLLQSFDLNEIGFGEWEGVGKEELEKSCPDNYFRLWNDPVSYIPPRGAESFEDFFSRIRFFSSYLFEQAKEKNILVVTHGIWLKAFYCIFQEKSLEQIWEPPYIPNTALSVLDTAGAYPVFLKEGDVSHLEGK